MHLHMARFQPGGNQQASERRVKLVFFHKLFAVVQTFFREIGFEPQRGGKKRAASLVWPDSIKINPKFKLASTLAGKRRAARRNFAPASAVCPVAPTSGQNPLMSGAWPDPAATLRHTAFPPPAFYLAGEGRGQVEVKVNVIRLEPQRFGKPGDGFFVRPSCCSTRPRPFRVCGSVSASRAD